MLGILQKDFPIKKLWIGLPENGSANVEFTTHEIEADFFPNQHFITHEVKDLWYFKWAGLMRKKKIEPGDRLNVEIVVPLYASRGTSLTYLFELFVYDVRALWQVGSIQTFSILGRTVSEVGWSVSE